MSPIHLRPSPDMSSPLPPYKQIYFAPKHNPIKDNGSQYIQQLLILKLGKLTITKNVNASGGLKNSVLHKNSQWT